MGLFAYLNWLLTSLFVLIIRTDAIVPSPRSECVRPGLGVHLVLDLRCMTGESQKIERILTEFSLAFVATAKDARLLNADAVMVRGRVGESRPILPVAFIILHACRLLCEAARFMRKGRRSGARCHDRWHRHCRRHCRGRRRRCRCPPRHHERCRCWRMRR